MKPVLLSMAALALAGCASVSPKQDFDEVSKLNQERGGNELHWDEGSPADDQVKAHVHALAEGVLTPDTAVEIALLRNQGLIATYEELGIAQAELVQAGLLRNPSFGARVRFPSGGGAIDTEFSITQDFLDLFTLGLRKRVAAARLDAAKARVGGAVLELSAEVRAAIVNVQAAQAMVEIRKLVVDAQAAAAELRRRQYTAGNVAAIDRDQEEVFYQQGKLDLARAEAQVVAERERANHLLGLWGEESAAWSVESKMADLPATELPLEHLESLAISRRLDLAAARADSQALEETASLAGATRYFPALQLGISTESDTEGNRVTGPQLDIELPIFDQGRAGTAKILSEVRRARAKQAELAVNIRAEVRALRSRLFAARGIAEQYRTVLLPLREHVVKESQLRYNSMLLGAFQLLQARREEIEAYRDYLEAVRDYWTTRADLERAVGGTLSTQFAAEQKP